MPILIARKRKTGTFYFIRHNVDGKRVEHACNTTNRRHAEAIFREYQRAILDKEEAVAQDAVTYEDLEAHYRAWSQTHHRPATQEQYIWALRTFSAACETQNVAQTKPQHIHKFMMARINGGVSPRTVNATIIALNAILNIATEMLWYTGPNPFEKVKRLKQPKRHAKWLDKEQIEAVLSKASDWGQDAVNVFALGIYAGLRKSEIVEAKWEWFDWESGLIHVRSSDTWVMKDQEDRTLPIHEKLTEILAPIKKESGYIVSPVSKHSKGKKYRYDMRSMFKTVCTAAGVPWCTPHILRHTFASQLASAGVSLKKIGVWMGHSGSAITDIYAHLQLQDDDINSF